MSRSTVTNAMDREQQRLAERKRRERQRREIEDIHAVMTRPEGRRFMWRLIEQCGVFASVFSVSSADMGHRAGKQDFGHDLMTMLQEADPECYVIMLQEAQAQRRADIREVQAFHAERDRKAEEEDE